MVLQDEVAFTLYYFCGGGGELLYGLKRDSIIFEKDADGKEYATLSHLVVQKMTKVGQAAGIGHPKKPGATKLKV